ncbi:hypothetical protein JQX08_10045 [Pseudomonas sp. UL073]|uniref:Methyltransferase n=1 Tax=Zestomonas insulae TaxID=2809017 RepID=A0ABS2IEF1_9GAMM|nr:CmcJ/NvfI family oxidoreductase [Pseudomonas insulae]MBM7061048.1 hypothetical protein [Pseudomonas insulae]
MTNLAAKQSDIVETLPFVTAEVNYAGEISGRAVFDTVEPDKMNIAFVPSTVQIRDVRKVRDTFNLDTHGFAYVRHSSEAAARPELRDQNLTLQGVHSEINEVYQSEIAAYLQQLTGAREVIAQTSGLLVRTSNRAKKKSWATPATFVHLDFTEDSANKFLRWSLEETGIDIKPYRRFMVFQTWRVISGPPQDSTLAICDGRSASGTDAVVMDSVIGPRDKPGAFFESRLCLANPAHQWYYLSDMEPEDLLIFKGFDSDIPHSMNAMHTAFDDPSATDQAIPRVSVEARFFAFFD